MQRYRAEPDSRFKLRKIRTDDTADFDDTPKGEEDAKAKTKKHVEKLGELQEKLFANAQRALLIVFQGTDTSGKDGVIEKVMSSVNPQGCRVYSFKAPTAEEAAHDFLWRIHRHVPAKGFIGIFNRSHYEDVIYPPVHDLIDRETTERRYDHINDFEKLLVQNGTAVLKFFLHISKDEQRKRLQARADDPHKRWKFNINDLAERKHWDRYQDAFQSMLRATSTEHAPWVVVPADRKWFRNYVVAKAVVRALEDMDLRYPQGPKGVDFDKLKIR